MAAVTRRNHHHQSAREEKGDDSGSRNRNDSGCCFDEEAGISGGGSGVNMSNVGRHGWCAVVNQWSETAHLVIEQERRKMLELTEKRWREATTTQDRDAAEEAWREDVSAIMETAHDLLLCVANDVREMASSATSSEAASDDRSSHSMTSQDLGQILEEELFPKQQRPDEGETGSKIYVVTTKTDHKKRKRRRARKRSPRDKEEGVVTVADEESNTVEVNGRVFEQGSSFTIQVDELKATKKDVAWTEDETIVVSSPTAARWRKNSYSPFEWKEDAEEEEASVGKGTDAAAVGDPEDIYWDWLRMRRRDRHQQEAEINDVFWNISLESDESANRLRKRRISQVLENLPFDDHPDIFSDRCELLECSAPSWIRNRKGQRVNSYCRPGGSSRQVKLYWNIFNEWKRNLDDERHQQVRRRRDRKRKKGNGFGDGVGGRQQRRSRAPPKREAAAAAGVAAREVTKERTVMTKRVFGKKKKARKQEAEDFFSDAIGMFWEEEEGSRSRARRRSRDDMEAEDGDGGDNKEDGRRCKKLKSNEQPRNSFDLITKSIEQKIREAFALVDYQDEEDDEDDDDVSLMLAESREEFTELRDEVRRMRKAWRRAADRKADEAAAAFADWRWNLDEANRGGRRPTMYAAESVFQDWVGIFEAGEEELAAEDYFADWKHNLTEKKAASSHRASAAVVKKSVAVVGNFEANRTGPAGGRRGFLRRANHNSGAQKAAKAGRRVMVRCLPKQPKQRRTAAAGGGKK